MTYLGLLTQRWDGPIIYSYIYLVPLIPYGLASGLMSILIVRFCQNALANTGLRSVLRCFIGNSIRHSYIRRGAFSCSNITDSSFLLCLDMRSMLGKVYKAVHACTLEIIIYCILKTPLATARPSLTPTCKMPTIWREVSPA